MNRKSKITTLLAGVVGLVFSMYGSGAFATVVGSVHDFSGSFGGGEICKACHTPHNAKAVVGAPLWNHEVSTATYTLYTSATFQGSGSIGQPSGTSKLCLSCHDGTVALENYGTVTGGTQIIAAARNFGTDLSNDHPISFTYDDTLAGVDGGLALPGVDGINLAAVELTGNTVECASCHDVHNNAGGFATLLRVSNANSDLCLTCHTK